MKRAQRRRLVGITTLFGRLSLGVLLAGVAVTTLLPLNAYSTEQEVVGTITRLYSYNQYQEGDVVVEMTNLPAQCAQGFWLKGDDKGAKNTYSMLLSAYHTQAAVRIAGEDTQMWSGSSTSICRIRAVALD